MNIHLLTYIYTACKSDFKAVCCKNVASCQMQHLLVRIFRTIHCLHHKPNLSSHTSNARTAIPPPSAESSRSVRGLGKGVSGKPYPHLCNAMRPRLESGTYPKPITIIFSYPGFLAQQHTAQRHHC